MAAALRLALTAAVRVVDRVHGRAAHGGALAEPAAAAGLAAGLIRVIGVADLTDGRPTGERDATKLARWEPQDCVRAVLRDELDRGARRARHACALSRLQLDAVDERARRDVRERERVAGLDVGLWAGLDGRADAKTRRREDVRLEAVRVVEQGDTGRPVGVVLDRGHLRRDTVLRALEVDGAEAALVPAALVAGGDAAAVVPSALLRERLEKRLLGLGLRDLLEAGGRHEATARARGLVLLQRHQTAAPSKISIS